jgi:hypothetical protein
MMDNFYGRFLEMDSTTGAILRRTVEKERSDYKMAYVA